MTKWKEINLGELLDKEQVEDVELLLRERDWKNLRIYLNKLKEQLEKKGILPDYLYYVLKNKFER